jgi:hypothetical protein
MSAASRLTQAGRARRRFNCDEQTEWEDRAIAAARLLGDNPSNWASDLGRPVTIADFGAGNERLRTVLAATLPFEHSYHPFDLYPQKATTTRLNVVTGLPDQTFDVGICLGLLEYLPSISAIADSLYGHCHLALVSFVTADGPASIGRPEREENHWTTHATEAELLADFGFVGFKLVASVRSDQGATFIGLWSR